MFSEYQGFLNLDQILKDEYDYEFDGDLSKLYEQDFIEVEGNGVGALCWISYKGDKYLFKQVPSFEYNVWGELISEEFAKRLGVECASYRACSLGEQKGVITKSFLKDRETLILGSEIFQRFLNRHAETEENLFHEIMKNCYEVPEDYFKLDAYNQKKYLFHYLNNLEHIWYILNGDVDISKEEIKKSLQFLETELVFDIITMQLDRHPNNWGLKRMDDSKKENKCSYEPSCLYDNASSFGVGVPFIEDIVSGFRGEYFNCLLLKDEERLDRLMYRGAPDLTMSCDNVVDFSSKRKDIGPIVLNDYLSYTSLQSHSPLVDQIDSLDTDFFDECLKSVEENNGIVMQGDVYYYMVTLFEYNIGKLKNVCNSFKRSSGINEQTVKGRS